MNLIGDRLSRKGLIYLSFTYGDWSLVVVDPDLRLIWTGCLNQLVVSQPGAREDSYRHVT